MSGRVLTASAINSHNTFFTPTAVEPNPFTAATIAEGKVLLEMPAKAVVVLELQQRHGRRAGAFPRQVEMTGIHG